MIDTSPFSFDVFRVNQPIGEYYVALIPAKLLLLLSYSRMLTLLKSTEDGEYNWKGAQRPINRSRTRAIGRFIDTIEAVFPSSIILAANYSEEGDIINDEAVRWRVEIEEGATVGKLIIPTRQRIASVIDGQHRLFGFTFASKMDRQSMPIICSVFLDLPNPFQAQIFATINHNQKPVNKSLSYQLYGFNIDDEDPDEWSPEKLAVFLSRKMNTDSSSLFENRIVVGAQDERVLDHIADTKSLTWSVSTATIVDGIIRLISQKPHQDRDTIHARPSGAGRSRSLVRDSRDKSPLRDMYLEGNDTVIYTVILNFYGAASEVFNFDEKSTFISKTVGIQALFEILRKAAAEALRERSIGKSRFRKLLSPAQDIDFTDRFFHASGAGKVRIRKAIELAVGMTLIEEIKAEDQEDYLRVVKGLR